MPRKRVLFGLLLLALMVALLLDLLVGDVMYTPREVVDALLGRGDTGIAYVVNQVRLTRVLVALAVGISLPVCGLMMQTMFENPLADPYILGVSSGTSLGVALFMLGVPLLGAAVPQWVVSFGVLGAGWLGAIMVLLLIMVMSHRISNIFGVLIIGVMLSYIVSSVIQILQYYSSAEQLKRFTLWSLGSFSTVTWSHLQLLLPLVGIGLILSLSAIKSLNLQLLGDEYAQTMGMNLRTTRLVVFGATTLMTGTVTTYCGPIGFIGLAIPHATRFIFRTSDHSVLIPATMLVGGTAMLLCDVIAKVMVIPINSVTALLGIPIILKVVFSQLKK